MSGYQQGSGHHDGGALGGSNTRDTRDSGYGSGHSGNSSQGPVHSSNLLNKLDPRVKNTDTTTGTGAGYGSGTTGTHGTTGTTGTHGTHGTHGTTGTTGTGHSGYGGNTTQHENPRSTNAGPHSSNWQNTADPRIDSDRSTGAGYGTGHQTSGPHSGYGSNTQHESPRSTNAGPHDSNMANKVDPRVDSDRDSRGAGYGTGAGHTSGTHTGPTGAGYGSGPGHTGTQHSGYGSNTQHESPRSTNAGPHDSNMANKLDPRVDSDRDSKGAGYGSGNTHSGHGSHTSGPGYGNTNTSGNNTAGPHNSDMLNKLDPRVDSDRDGKSGLGQSHNTQGSNTQPTQISSAAEGHGHDLHHGKNRDHGNATANASVTGGGVTGAPEGQASASGPRDASANTTTGSSGIISKGLDKLAGRG